MNRPRVLNKRQDGIPEGAVYVGRGSKWGNPYRITRWKDRATVIRWYGYWLDDQVAAGRLDPEELRGKDLVCYCAPLPCHADRLLELANTPIPEATP